MRKLNHIERQYIRWWKYAKKCTENKKKETLFKQAILLSDKIGRQRN